MENNKETLIRKIKENLNKYQTDIRNNQALINKIEKRFVSFVPKSHNEFRQSLKFSRSLVRLINRNNLFQAKVTSYKYALKKAELSTGNDYNRLTLPELAEYINYIEELSKDELFPAKLHTVNRIKESTRKLYALRTKHIYLSNVALPKARGPKKTYLRVRIKQLAKNIDYYRDYIRNLKLVFANKYIATLVNQLEHDSKKNLNKKSNSPYIIDFQNVLKYYSNGSLVTKVLKDVNLQIKYGEFVVILGPSGSGKTTLLNIISGMDTATYGQTVVANHNLIGYNSTQLTKFRRDNIGYIFQQYGLLPNLTVRENVEIGSNLQKDKSKRLDIDDLLKTVGIYEQRNKYPRELSGGQQQRVSITRSMAKNPRLIFGDEPTGAIDEEMSKQVMQLFIDINRRYKTTVIIVTHNPILADLATMTIKVANGKIDKIIRNPHPKSVYQLNWGKI
ncbi:MAG: ABC transporter ATP-binding protein [Mycoplasmataceae bacterium]|jgi:ABC-type lipoprotein export system ATPase subunit|nr:ABC transporter ATP-binding protein [Mycoplasmataceae bacterium]